MYVYIYIYIISPVVAAAILVDAPAPFTKTDWRRGAWDGLFRGRCHTLSRGWACCCGVGWMVCLGAAVTR